MESLWCRLCFTHVTEYINIYGNPISYLDKVQVLKHYFHDEVNESDNLPKIICCQCWHKVEEFRMFCEKTAVLRKEYLQQHLNVNMAKCDYGGPSFPNMDQIHSENICVELMPLIHCEDMETVKNKYHCEQCPEMFSDQIYLENHMRLTHTKHSNGTVKELENLKHSSRKSHGNAMTNKMEMQQHFTCSVCQKQFFSEISLNMHLYVHNPINNFICEYCAKVFETKQALHQHQRTHKSQPQKCDQCDKVSPNLMALRLHIRAVHVECNFKCHLCNKSFKQQPSLRDHIATHQNNKNYKCAYCDETFIWRSNMYKHQKQSHKQEWLADKVKKDAAKLKPTENYFKY